MTSPNGRLAGKTALITGGTSGIGLATARLFQDEGARVAITGQHAQRVTEAGLALGPRALALRADVCKATDMAALAETLRTRWGGVDVLFANAGIAEPRPLADADAAHVDRLVDVNFKGVLHTVQALLPLLRPGASVILTSTTLTEQGVPGLGVYSATKAAVRSLARTLTAEWLGRGIRVNVLSPGLVQTPIYGKLGLAPEAVQAWAGALMAKVPAARFAQPDEMARAALFLASDDSAYMAGENLVVDGAMASV